MPGNIAAVGPMIDWDRCGAYPPGYEFGRTLGSLVQCNDMADFEAVVSGCIRRACAGSPGSLEFFTAVFYARQMGVRVSDDVILALFDRARDLRGLPVDTRRSA